MTIHKDGQTQFIECDLCGETLERGSDTKHFDEWIDALKDGKWKFINAAGTWKHRCPTCVEMHKESRR